MEKLSIREYNDLLFKRKLGGNMPFKKVGKNKYKSPSGRTYTKKQVGLYYATEGFTKSSKKYKKRKK